MDGKNWWEKVLRHPGWTAISVISTIIVGVAGLVVTRAGTDAPSGPPGDLLEQIEQSDVWVDPPRVFETAGDDFPVPGSVAAVSDGDVIAFTPEELADQAVRYEGDPVYVVGRAADIRAVPSDFGLSDEVRLVSDDGSVAFVGTGLFLEAEGSIVFALGRVAAVGKTRLPSGRIVDAAYLVAFSASTGGAYDIGSVDLDSPLRSELSPSIVDAARRASAE